MPARIAIKCSLCHTPKFPRPLRQLTSYTLTMALLAPLLAFGQEAAKTGTEPTEAEQVDAVVKALEEDEPAAGLPQPEELLVQGTRESRPQIQLKDVPLSISLVTGVELEKFNTLDFRNILTKLGNVRASYTNPQAGSLILRGVGWATGAGPLDPSVGVTVDG